MDLSKRFTLLFIFRDYILFISLHFFLSRCFIVVLWWLTAYAQSPCLTATVLAPSLLFPNPNISGKRGMKKKIANIIFVLYAILWTMNRPHCDYVFYWALLWLYHGHNIRKFKNKVKTNARRRWRRNIVFYSGMKRAHEHGRTLTLQPVTIFSSMRPLPLRLNEE